MKVRDSGMPDEDYWASFFDAEKAIEQLLPHHTIHGDWIEFGGGYGTFTLPAAKRISGTLNTFDIEPEMTKRIKQISSEQNVNNLIIEQRDFVQFGTGLPSHSQSGVMIYNLLHLENPVVLLQEAFRALKSGGCLSVIHWRTDIPTPRGPALAIRPTPVQCAEWMELAGFTGIERIELNDCCPYHYGLIAWA